MIPIEDNLFIQVRFCTTFGILLVHFNTPPYLRYLFKGIL